MAELRNRLYERPYIEVIPTMDGILFLQSENIDITTARELIIARTHWLLIGGDLTGEGGWYQLGSIDRIELPEIPDTVHIRNLPDFPIFPLVESLNCFHGNSLSPEKGVE